MECVIYSSNVVVLLPCVSLYADQKKKAMVSSLIFLVHILKDTWALDIAPLNRGNLVP
jgi:hypothetical protein